MRLYIDALWLVGMMVVLPILWLLLSRLYLARHAKKLQMRIGHCNSCGYDLTGNLSGVCPECGTALHTRVP